MGYLYLKFQDAEFECNTPERRAFKAHLGMVAKGLKAIEWVDSGDWGPGDENMPILECVQPNAAGYALAKVKEMRDDLTAIIDKYDR